MGKLSKFVQPASRDALDTLLTLCVYAPHRSFAVAVQHLAHSFHHRLALTLLARRVLHRQPMGVSDLNKVLKSMYMMTPSYIAIAICSHIETSHKNLFGHNKGQQNVGLPVQATDTIQQMAVRIAEDLDNSIWIPSLPSVACQKGFDALVSKSSSTTITTMMDADTSTSIESDQELIDKGGELISRSQLDSIQTQTELLVNGDAVDTLEWCGPEKLRQSLGKVDDNNEDNVLKKRDIIKLAQDAIESTVTNTKKYSRMYDILEKWNNYCDNQNASYDDRPNARSYALLFAACVKARHIDWGKQTLETLTKLIRHNVIPQEEQKEESTYKHLVYGCQPELLREAADAGILCDSTVSKILNPPVGTAEWCFLNAAACAKLGDQKGSKHGAMIALPLETPHKGGGVCCYSQMNPTTSTDSIYLCEKCLYVFGQNHVSYLTAEQLKEAQNRSKDSFNRSLCCEIFQNVAVDTTNETPRKKQRTSPAPTSRKRSHQKHIMHSEMHAAVKMLMFLRDNKISRANVEVPLLGAHCWVVELDGVGIGYEEAVPCAMCNMGLIRLGVSKVYYSDHNGVQESKREPQTNMGCVSLELGLLNALQEKD